VSQDEALKRKAANASMAAFDVGATCSVLQSSYFVLRESAISGHVPPASSSNMHSIHRTAKLEGREWAAFHYLFTVQVEFRNHY